MGSEAPADSRAAQMSAAFMLGKPAGRAQASHVGEAMVPTLARRGLRALRGD